MKIVFTGGGSGGHFYPIIAIAEAVRDEVRTGRLIEPRLYYFGPNPFDARALFENSIVFVKVPAGKMRRYASVQNFFDLFTTLRGFFSAFMSLFRIYPDVIVSKGGYVSVPVVLAGALLRIPIIVHESDSKPGRANLLGARFATRIGVAYEETAERFPKKLASKIARVGIPVRKEVLRPETAGAREYLKLESSIPTVLILGGSLGAQRINEAVTAALPELVSFANVIHQTGTALYSETEGVARVVLEHSPHKERYHPYPYLDEISLRRAAGVADLIVSRAGSSAITEISLWKKPAVLIPIPEKISHDQRTNAYAYARHGGAVVLEEANLTPHLLASEVRRISGNPALAKQMSEAGARFADPDAAKIIAKEIVAIALTHE